MPIAILYFLAASALGVGGPMAAALLIRRGRQVAAAHLQARDHAAVTKLLQEEIDLASLREQARRAGVDPDVIEQGYRDMRDGIVTIDQVVAHLRTLGHG